MRRRREDEAEGEKQAGRERESVCVCMYARSRVNPIRAYSFCSFFHSTKESITLGPALVLRVSEGGKGRGRKGEKRKKKNVQASSSFQPFKSSSTV